VSWEFSYRYTLTCQTGLIDEDLSIKEDSIVADFFIFLRNYYISRHKMMIFDSYSFALTNGDNICLTLCHFLDFRETSIK